MAYLSDSEEENQQNASQPQSGFNIFAPSSSAMDVKSSSGGGGGAGGSYSSASNQSGAQSAPDQNSQTSDTSNRNAQNYSVSLSGTSGGTAAPAQQTNIHQPASSVMGLGSSTPGGGYVNYSAYKNANPSMAPQISSAGQNLVSSEKSSAKIPTANDVASGLSTAIPIFSDNKNTIGAGIPYAPSGKDIESLLTSGNDADLATLKGLANETYTAPQIGYTPSKNWQTGAPQLSQTSVLGGQAPSVIDYLAKSNIDAGNYTGGERLLDQALVAGDPGSQQAIQRNQQLFANWINNAAGQVKSAQGAANVYAALAPTIASATTSDLSDIGAGITRGAQSQADNANKAVEAQKLAEAKAYLDWYNSGGYNTGNFNINNTAGQAATTSNYLTPEQITELNNIGSILGNGPTSESSAGAANPGSYGYTITPGAAPGMPMGVMPGGGVASTLSSQDPNAPGFYGIESAVQSGQQLNDQQVNSFLGQMTPSQLQGIYGSLQQQIAEANSGGNTKGAQGLRQEAQYVSQAIKDRQQDPNSLIAGLGLTPADLAALGL